MSYRPLERIKTMLSDLPEEQRGIVVESIAPLFVAGYLIASRRTFQKGEQWQPNYEGFNGIREFFSEYNIDIESLIKKAGENTEMYKRR